MQNLLELHDGLLDALASDDLDRFGTLIGTRGELIAALDRELAGADDAAREAARPTLDRLQDLDRELRERATTVRDEIARQMTQRLTTSTSGRTSVSGIIESGVIDRRA